MFKHPPQLLASPFDGIEPGNIMSYLGYHSIVDGDGKYLHFDQLRRRLPKSIDAVVAWSLIKDARRQQQSIPILLGEPEEPCKFVTTPAILRAMSLCDQKTTTAALTYMTSQIGEGKQIQYLMTDLINEEAISSSQLEGSATTTKVAKSLLQTERKGKDEGEKMIIGNYRMMECAWKNRNEPLTAELMLELHLVGVEGIDDEHYHPGTLRNNDDIEVRDGDGNIVHQPPPAATLKYRLSAIIDWINRDHTNTSDPDYIHPLIKAIIIHFAMGFEHPFHDGNGRVARALFYWFMFREGFSAFRYIAISTLLKAAPKRYGMSYVYSETDDMDLTYFVDYQCQTITRAITLFLRNFDDALKSLYEFEQFLFKSGLFRKLSANQRIVFNFANSKMATDFTANSVMTHLGCSYNTAASVLNGLVEYKVFKKRKEGKTWVYSMETPEAIRKTLV
ncbi:Fic family protein [Pseudomonas sp. S31]|uniref:Fic family protein n=1 Tax=Pseudomonas sp. S31 TaxID=1564473 RepID=UPI0019118F03|nr:Fic family protein [Pseudomonas sp. S31]MBK5001460.1 Fic family protein [Pseudomonas sp. S31]